MAVCIPLHKCDQSDLTPDVTHSQNTRTAEWLDNALSGLTLYLLPALILMLTVWSLVAWPEAYPTPQEQPLSFRAAVDESASWTPAQAAKALQDKALVWRHDTQLSELPVWFALQAPAHAPAWRQVVEFPSRHATQISCWDQASLALLGHATRNVQLGGLRLSRGGFALIRGTEVPQQALICKAEFVGPAQLTALQWSETHWISITRDFDHNAGLLSGGLLVLTAFILITALVTRSRLHLLFAVWLLVNLRMASLSAGWDVQWLERMIPINLLSRSRLLTVALFFVVGVTLFSNLLRKELQETKQTRLLKVVQSTCLPLLVLSLFLSFSQFLPILWVFTSIGGLLLLWMMARILMAHRTPVVLLYSASISITLLGSLYEIGSAALGMKSWIGTINSVTAALSSSLLASLAIAAQMRQEAQQKEAAQHALRHTFEVIPIGLFTLDLKGRFLSANPALLALLGPALLEEGSNQWSMYFSPESLMRLTHMVGTQAEAELEVESRRDTRQQEHKHFLIKASLASDRIEGSLEDITDKAKALSHLQYLALHDPLTKLLNRTGIQDALVRALSDPRSKGQVAVAFIDLDRFKLINHIYGNNAGDDVIRQVAARLSNLVSGEMQLGRVGGDEFWVFGKGC